MSKNTPRGADHLARALRAAGVANVFSLSGNHIMPLYDALLEVGIAIVHTRHEAAAVHMADAWGRLTGQPGVALVTGGPGHANAVGALYTALMAESPLVLLSGHAPLNQLGQGAFQEMAQAELAAPLTKGSFTATRATALAGEFAQAWQLALAGRPGPVHLSLPVDVLEARVDVGGDAGGGPGGHTSAPSPAAPAPQALAAAHAQALVQWLRGANRPLVLTGPQSLTRRGRAHTAALQAALGMPVIGMESPRGTADPSLGACAEMLAQADAVLLVGKRLDFTLKFGQAPTLQAACAIAQVDAEASELQRSQRAVGARLQHALVADAMVALGALAAAARAAVPPLTADAGWFNDVQAALAWRPAAWADARASQPGDPSAAAPRLHPVQACRPLQALLDEHPDSVLVSDGGEIGQWAQACLQAPHRLINGAAGSIGSALPFALAARLALPEAPVVALMGDGTFGFHAAEIDTAVRHRLPFVAVVGNDARWNAEHQIQLREYGAARTVGCELLPTRYERVCEAFGGHGERVTEAAELLPAARRAQASGLPAVLNVMIDGLPAPNLKR